jgi:hypothetical protein
MIGDTLTVTYDSVANTLVKINQDQYSSEYLKRTATEELRVRIRNTNESSAKGQNPFERHQVELTRTEYDTVNGDRIFTASTVIRLRRGTNPDVAEKVALALCGMLNASFVDKVVNWES